jgi:hypothetical protein
MRDKGSILTLWVHNDLYSKLDVIVNPEALPGIKVGNLLEIYKIDKRKGSPSKRLILRVQQIDKDLLAKQTQLQISICQNIATLFELVARNDVTVRKIETDSYLASHIEISFRDQYVGRSDMWQVKNDIMNTSVYSSKKITSLGFRGSVKEIYVDEERELCGVITENTKIIFRSETAKYFLFIQMSKEMWEFDEDGEMFFAKCVHGFLPELFSKWKCTGTNHVVSIILFTRILYNERPYEVPLNTALKFHKDAYGRYCRDFYRVVVDWETRVDWAQILVPLKHEFVQFQQEVLQQQDFSGSTVLSGSSSPASEGNILEAINLALNPFDKHYVDRDLSRTGLSIIIVTPGTGIFEGSLVITF